MSRLLKQDVILREADRSELRLESQSYCAGCRSGCGLHAANTNLTLPAAALAFEASAGTHLQLVVSQRGLTAVAGLIFGVPLLLWLLLSWILTPYLSELQAGTIGALVPVAALWQAGGRADALLAIISPRLLERS